MYNDIKWTYRGIDALIEFDVEPDNIKAFHYVTTPDDTVRMLDISPYDRDEQTVNDAIDYYHEHGEFEKEVKNYHVFH